jgi:PKD repeat protein
MFRVTSVVILMRAQGAMKDGSNRVNTMKKRILIPLGLWCILVVAILGTPVAGLAVAEGVKITAPDGATSPMIIVESGLAQGGIITIDITGLNTFTASGTFTSDNVILDNDAVTAGWTSEVADGNLTLTSAGRAMDPGEIVTVTFTGAAGNPWIAYTGGAQTITLLATMPDLIESASFNFIIQTGGLSITDGAKITTTDGATSPVITITDAPIAPDDTITIDISYVNWYVVASTVLTSADIVISDTASAADWTGAVDGDTVTLTSAGGQTAVGENVSVTFTGAGNPWIDNTGGSQIYNLTVTRTDGLGEGTIGFAVETGLTGGLTVTDGPMITAADGTSSVVITITGSEIVQDATITIDVKDLHPYVASGIFTSANVVTGDTSAAANWIGSVEDDTLTLTSADGPTGIGENVTVTFTGEEEPWVDDSGGEYLVPLKVTRSDGLGAGTINFAIRTEPSGDLSVEDGMKITAPDGASSPVITITNADIVQDGTITIDVTSLNAFVASGNFTTVNVAIDDTAAATWTAAVADNTLMLTSTGGTTTTGETVTVTFTGAAGNPWVADTGGNQTVSLTATRTDTLKTANFSFVIDTGGPVANFSASKTADIAPLSVQFTDTSLGGPTSWNWDFGDGTNSSEANPDHIYMTVGGYTVSLTVTNSRGSNTKIRTNYINVLNGGVRDANTSIEGLTITNCGGPQTITVDIFTLPAALIPNNSVLEIQPPADRGLKNITLYALNGIGFSRNGNLITGNPTGVHLVTEDIGPSSGFSSSIGTNSSFSYGIDLSSYPCNALLSTKIWEGEITEYDTKLWMISSNNSAVPIGTAYTADITKTNFPPGTNVKVRMSVNSNWNPALTAGPGNMFIWRIADDGNSGQILPTNFLYTETVNNLDYFEADSPHGLSTFGLSSLTGNNNPFQMIVFALQEVINPGNPDSSDTDSQSAGGGSGSNAIAITPNQTSGATSVSQDPGRTAKIYANTNGVITQNTTLRSTDGSATVNIGTGVVARDIYGKPLSSITIKAIPSENLPNALPGGSYSFAGKAFEILPDGASFSPGISINFAVPNVQFGQKLMVKMFDHATDSWQDVPSSLNPETGIITAHISHFCCFALFAETVILEPTSVSTPEPVPPTANAPAPTAMSTFMGMILWVADLIQKNIIIFAGLIILAIAIFLHGRKRRRDRLMYLL